MLLEGPRLEFQAGFRAGFDLADIEPLDRDLGLERGVERNEGVERLSQAGALGP